MVWYVAVIAVLNLGLGYVLALYLGSGHKVAYAAVDDEYIDDDYSDDDDEIDE